MTRLSGSLWLDLSHWVFVLTKVERCWNGHAGRMGWNSNLSFYLILVLWNAVACLSYLSSSEICDHFSKEYDCTFDILWQPSNTDSASISLLTPQQVSLRSVLLNQLHVMQQWWYWFLPILPILAILPSPTQLPSPSEFQANLLGRTPHRGATRTRTKIVSSTPWVSLF